MIKARNLLDNKIQEVYEHRGFYYLKTTSKALPIYVLAEIVDVPEEAIEYGHRYVHYEINGVLYTGFLTNGLNSVFDTLKPYQTIQQPQYQQLSLF